MIDNPATGKYQPSIWARALAGALAAVTMMLGLAGWLAVRTFAVKPLVYVYVKPLAQRWFDEVSFVLLGFLWLILVYLSAHFYQKALERRRLWRLFAKVTLIQVLAPALVVSIVFVLVQFILARQ